MHQGRGRRMLWMAFWIAVVAVGALGLLVTVQGQRFERRVRDEARAIFARAGAGVAGRPALAALPPAVGRYAEVSGAVRHAPIRAARLTHRGSFRMSTDGGWLPIRGTQYFTSDPPGFVWWGRVRVAPGVWIDGRDRTVLGEGNMLVRVASTWTVADARGPRLDESALQRLLGELAWIPTALLDPRYVTWSPVDDRSARAVLRVGGREVTATFEFDASGLPSRFVAARYQGDVLAPFVCEYRDWREVDGVRVPFRVEASWVVDGTPRPYARWELERFELDRAEPF